jgi:hypothetical protein
MSIGKKTGTTLWIRKKSCRRGLPKHDGNRSLRNQNKLVSIGDKPC